MIARASAFTFAGAPGEDRTRGLLIRSETLYPLSYERIWMPGVKPGAVYNNIMMCRKSTEGDSEPSRYLLEVVFLVSDWSEHEVIHCFPYGDVAVDDIIDGVEDRHLYACLLGQLTRHLCGIHSF